jgi:hypothetical protein
MLRKLTVLAACAAFTLTACTTSHTHQPASSASTSPSPKATSSVIVTGLPSATKTVIADEGTASAPGSGLAFASHVYSIGPSGPLTHTAHVTIPLTEPLPAGTPVVVATRETVTSPWSYLPAMLSGNRRTVSFTTTHFSLFGALWIDVKEAVAAFKKDFIDGLDSGATQSVDRPTCQGEKQARADGYQVSSSSTDAVYWCFGVAHSHRVLKVVDDRRYPLLVLHPHMSVLSNDYNRAELAALSHIGSGPYAILAPGATITFNADLSSGASEGVSTQMDGLGQSLYALQVGVETLVNILTRFGAGSGVKSIDTFGKLLTVRSCAAALGQGSGALITGCLSPKDVLDAFGVKGLLLAPIMAASEVVSFLRGEWNALVDQFNRHDRYQIGITRPVQVWFPGSYPPQARAVSANWSGDGTGIVAHMQWSGWTSTSADGTGEEGIDDCVPDCAGGTFTYYPVRLHAYSPMYLRCGVFFSHVDVTYLAAVPQYEQRQYTFSIDPAHNALDLYTYGSCAQ